MARVISGSMVADIGAEQAEIVHFIQLDFSGGTLHLCTAPQNITWNSVPFGGTGTLWTGLGGVFSFSPVSESNDLSSAGLDLVLSGVDQTVLAILFAQKYIGRTVDVWLGHIATTGVVVADPIKLFSGFMNGGWRINDRRDESEAGGGSVEIQGRCVDRLANLEQRRGMQTNMASHQAWYPGDKFFQYINQLSTISLRIQWTK